MTSQFFRKEFLMDTKLTVIIEFSRHGANNVEINGFEMNLRKSEHIHYDNLARF
jgi:hypothetical protein